MVSKEEEILGLQEHTEGLEPTAPPPPAYEDVIAEDQERERRRRENDLNKDVGDQRPGALSNTNVPQPRINKCHDKHIPASNSKPSQGPWDTDQLGELVENHRDIKRTKRKRQRKIKKGLGWSVWICCFPLAVIMNCMRDSPQDRDDPMDWNNDPLRPWNYKVNLNDSVH